jgi:hypothetical protein
VAGKTGAVTLVKADVGLSNVDNTADVNKPVSTAQAAADALALAKASNLSDLASAATARTNLGLGSAATQASTSFDAAGAAAAVQSGLVATPIKLYPAAGRGFGTTATLPSTPKLGISGQRFLKGTSNTQGVTWKLDLDPSWTNLKLTLVGTLVGSTSANNGQAIRWQVGTFGEAPGVLLADFPSGTGWTSQLITQTIATATAATQLAFVLSTSIAGWATGQEMCDIALVRLDNDAADTMAVSFDLEYVKVEAA